MEVDFFVLGITFLCLHELDAMRCHEWRIFPGLSLLEDRLGMIIFQLAHIPLFYWVFQGLNQPDESFRLGWDIFFIVHFILHVLFLWHPKNEFKDWLSWGIISGAAFFGVLDLLL